MTNETCAHCGLSITGPSRGHVGALLLHHTGTIPPQADPIDCYRLVTVYREPIGARMSQPPGKVEP